MKSIKATARKAGVLYFVFAIVAVIGEFLLPDFLVPGDAATTAGNITAAEPTYRIGILTSFITLVIFIFLVVVLYDLFKGINKSAAMLMVLLVLAGVAVAIANLLNKIAPLILLSGNDYLSAFTKPQLDALALGFLGWHRDAGAVVEAFWGLWLFPFGFLVIKSRFFPRILGILLMVAGVAYLISSATSMVLPAQKNVLTKILMPLYFGEVPIIFWLLLKGGRVPPPQAQSSPAG